MRIDLSESCRHYGSLAFEAPAIPRYLDQIVQDVVKKYADAPPGIPEAP